LGLVLKPLATLVLTGEKLRKGTSAKKRRSKPVATDGTGLTSTDRRQSLKLRYEHFLSEFPLCWGYWKRQGTTKMPHETFSGVSTQAYQKCHEYVINKAILT
jgi:hypothetical protein